MQRMRLFAFSIVRRGRWTACFVTVPVDENNRPIYPLSDVLEGRVQRQIGDH